MINLHTMNYKMHSMNYLRKCLNLSKKCSKQKKIILPLESKDNYMKMELDQVKISGCNKCQSLESKIVEINQLIKKYEKCQFGLENGLSRQNYSNDKYGEPQYWYHHWHQINMKISTFIYVVQFSLYVSLDINPFSFW